MKSTILFAKISNFIFFQFGGVTKPAVNQPRFLAKVSDKLKPAPSKVATVNAVKAKPASAPKVVKSDLSPDFCCVSCELI